MVDYSLCPCKICGHRQKDHFKHFAYCHACGIQQTNPKNPTSMHNFNRVDNLLYLEWAYKQNERTA
jgi:hypothetical protein